MSATMRRSSDVLSVARRAASEGARGPACDWLEWLRLAGLKQRESS
jgi:hypothetical protein